MEIRNTSQWLEKRHNYSNYQTRKKQTLCRWIQTNNFVKYYEKNNGINYEHTTYLVPGKINIINKEQSGFRRSKSTIDNLHIIKSEIDLALGNKQTLGMLSLEISKAYNSVWKHRVFIILSKIQA